MGDSSSDYCAVSTEYSGDYSEEEEEGEEERGKFSTVMVAVPLVTAISVYPHLRASSYPLFFTALTAYLSKWAVIIAFVFMYGENSMEGWGMVAKVALALGAGLFGFSRTGVRGGLEVVVGALFVFYLVTWLIMFVDCNEDSTLGDSFAHLRKIFTQLVAESFSSTISTLTTPFMIW